MRVRLALGVEVALGAHAVAGRAVARLVDVEAVLLAGLEAAHVARDADLVARLREGDGAGGAAALGGLKLGDGAGAAGLHAAACTEQDYRRQCRRVLHAAISSPWRRGSSSSSPPPCPALSRGRRLPSPWSPRPCRPRPSSRRRSSPVAAAAWPASRRTRRASARRQEWSALSSSFLPHAQGSGGHRPAGRLA